MDIKISACGLPVQQRRERIEKEAMFAATSKTILARVNEQSWIYTLSVFLLAGCAGASATTRSQIAPVNKDVPSQIVIYPLATSPSEITLNQSIVQRAYRHVSGEDASAAQLQLARQVAQDVCGEVSGALTKKGWSAACRERGTPIYGDNVLIVDGAFTDINEGNRLRRTVIGFGAGASTLDSSVQIYQHTGQRPYLVLDFTTHADSGKMPGAALLAPAGVAAGAGGAAVGGTNVAVAGAKGYTSSMQSLADKTAAQIVNQLETYFTQHGWTPKQPGR